jgi:3-hydroxybutyrate dehydrogenase
MKARNMPREQVIDDVILAGQPIKRFVTADPFAALSESATEITGANLSFDGGWTAA